MLRSHMNNIEELLVAQAKQSGVSGHPVNTGTPREIFVREFLRNHLSENVAIGSGEVIDHNSYPGERRNQIDIIIKTIA